MRESIIAGIIFAVAVCASVVALRMSTPSYEAILEKHGVPTTDAAWETWHNDAPDAPNAAPLYIEAVTLLDHDPAGALERLIAAGAYFECRLAFPGEHWPSPERGARSDTRRIWRFLEQEVAAALAEGAADSSEVAEGLYALVAFADAVQQQPAFPNYMLAGGVVSTVTAEWLPRALGAGALDFETLEALDHRLGRMANPDRARRAVLGTMRIWITDAGASAGFDGDRLPVQWLKSIARIPARRQAVFASDFLRIHGALAKPFPDRVAFLEAWQYSSDPLIQMMERVSRTPYRLALGSDPAHFLNGMTSTQTRIAAARGAIAVEMAKDRELVLPPDPVNAGKVILTRAAEHYRVTSASGTRFEYTVTVSRGSVALTGKEE